MLDTSSNMQTLLTDDVTQSAQAFFQPKRARKTLTDRPQTTVLNNDDGIIVDIPPQAPRYDMKDQMIYYLMNQRNAPNGPSSSLASFHGPPFHTWQGVHDMAPSWRPMLQSY